MTALTATTAIYRIHETQIDRVEKRLVALGKAAVKCDTGFRFQWLGEYEIPKIDKTTGELVSMDAGRILIVEADEIAKGDYEFIARIDVMSESRNAVVTRPGAQVDDATLAPYFTSNPTHCAACLTNRRRKSTFLVRHRETGALVQVGKQCLKLYMGIEFKDFMRWAKFLRRLDELAGYTDAGDRGPRITTMGTRLYVATCLAVARKADGRYGFVSKSAAHEHRAATANEALTVMFPPPKPTDAQKALIDRIKVTEADVVKAASMLDAAHTILAGRSNLSAFENTLLAIAELRADVIPVNKNGVAAFLPRFVENNQGSTISMPATATVYTVPAHAIAENDLIRVEGQLRAVVTADLEHGKVVVSHVGSEGRSRYVRCPPTMEAAVIRTRGEYDHATATTLDPTTVVSFDESKKRQPGYVGTPGKTIEVTAFYAGYRWAGGCDIHEFSVNGSLIKWFTESTPRLPNGEVLESGATVKIRCFIKRHTEYRAVRETHVNRVKVLAA